MKIQSIKFHDTADMQIEHPVTGEPVMGADGKPQTITLYGIQSATYRKAKHDSLNARLTRKAKTLTSEQAEDDAAALLAACTKAFNNVDLGEGPISTKAAKETYLECLWLKNQVDEFIADNASFLVK